MSIQWVLTHDMAVITTSYFSSSFSDCGQEKVTHKRSLSFIPWSPPCRVVCIFRGTSQPVLSYHAPLSCIIWCISIWSSSTQFSRQHVEYSYIRLFDIDRTMGSIQCPNDYGRRISVYVFSIVFIRRTAPQRCFAGIWRLVMGTWRPWISPRLMYLLTFSIAPDRRLCSCLSSQT